MKVVMRFCKKGKLNPKYVSTYKILKKVGKVEYEIELPVELAMVHPVFHISLLKKCITAPTGYYLKQEWQKRIGSPVMRF